MDERITKALEIRIDTLHELLKQAKEGGSVQYKELVEEQLNLSRAFMAYVQRRCFDCGKTVEAAVDVMKAADKLAEAHDWYD